MHFLQRMAEMASLIDSTSGAGEDLQKGRAARWITGSYDQKISVTVRRRSDS